MRRSLLTVLFALLVLLPASAAIVRIPGGMLIGPAPRSDGNPYINNALFLGAGGDGTMKVSMPFRVPKSGTLDKCEYLAGSVVGSNTARLSFQNIDLATGYPDGTQDQFRDLAVSASAWNAPGVMTHDGTNGGTKRTVTRDDLISCVIEFATYPGGVGFNVEGLAIPTNQGILQGTGYVDIFSGSAWSHTAYNAIIALKYDDGTYAFIQPQVYPTSSIAVAQFNSGSTPDERGVRFQVPFDSEAEGAWISVNGGSSFGDFDVVLYDAGGSVLQTIPADKDVGVTYTIPTGIYRRFPTAQSLTANTTYRLTVKPTSGTNVQIVNMTIPGSAYQGAIEGGTEWYFTARTDGGAFSDTQTERPFIGLVLSGVDTSSGGGGERSFVF